MPLIEESHAYPFLLGFYTARVIKFKMLSSFFNKIILILGLNLSKLRFSSLNLVEGPSIFGWILNSLFEVSCTVLVELHKNLMDGLSELFES